MSLCHWSKIFHFHTNQCNVKISSSVQVHVKIPHPGFVIQTLCILLTRNNKCDKPNNFQFSLLAMLKRSPSLPWSYRGQYEIKSPSGWYRKYNDCFWSSEKGRKMRVNRGTWGRSWGVRNHDPDIKSCEGLECNSVGIRESKAFWDNALNIALLRELKSQRIFNSGRLC